VNYFLGFFTLGIGTGSLPQCLFSPSIIDDFAEIGFIGFVFSDLRPTFPLLGIISVFGKSDGGTLQGP
jgi:hypothetical protein